MKTLHPTYTIPDEDTPSLCYHMVKTHRLLMRKRLHADRLNKPFKQEDLLGDLGIEFSRIWWHMTKEEIDRFAIILWEGRKR